MDSEDDSGSDLLLKSFNMKDFGIDSATDSDSASDLMMVDSGVDSGSALLWRILGLIIVF